jgi:general secretion pathway protein H
MPISATGDPPRRAAGFTLVELMVVMVIVGLASAAVVLALPRRSDTARGEARTLAARLVAARDLAIIGGRDVAVTIDAKGYRISQRHRDGWHAAEGRALQPHLWPEALAVTTEIADGDALRFDTTGLATPAKVRIDSDGSSIGISIDSIGRVAIDGA